MPTNTRNEPTTAACLTPPAAGGIAVVEVIGRHAPDIVNPLLQARRPVDLETLDPGELRFCRIVDRGAVLDDAVVAARRLPGGEAVVDINLHGGPRIVQRVLLALKAAGAVVVEGEQHAAVSWPVEGVLEREAVGLLAQAKTRAVAAWLARAPGTLRAEVRRIEGRITAERAGRMPAPPGGKDSGGQWQLAEAALAGLAGRFKETRYLIEGVRVVLTGEPNSGKSTLANALAGAEHSIVSPVAGTTRDWVELPAAIDGVPVTLVDTAGIRPSDDPLEQESIRRAQAQVTTADVVVQVVDRSVPHGQSGADRLVTGHDWHKGRPLQEGMPPGLLVWNKGDLPAHPGWGSKQMSSSTELTVSALTGTGLTELRQWVLRAVGMEHWTRQPARLYTQRQETVCREALGALAGQSGGDPLPAIRALVEGNLPEMI